MAKVITENFRVESSNEFVKSYRTNNEAVVRAFQEGLTSWNDDLPEQYIEEDYANTAPELVPDGQKLLDKQLQSITAIARQNINTILPQNTYYVMASSVSSDNDAENTQKTKREFQRRVLFGNKLDETNIRYMFRNNPWVTGTVYQAFDDMVDMEGTNFYVTVLDGDITSGSFKVFKCIRNGGGVPSVVRPSTSNLDIFFETTLEDGYIWKYMFEIPPSEYLVFATNATLPYFADNNVLDKAVERISDIIVENSDFAAFTDFLVGDRSEGSLKPAAAVLETAEIDSIPDQTYRLSLTSINPVRSQLNAYTNMYMRIVATGEIFDIIGSTIPTTPNIDASTNKTLVIFVKTATDMTQKINEEIEIVPKIEITRPDVKSLDVEQAIAYGVLDYTGTLKGVNFISKGKGYKNASAELVLPPPIIARAINNQLRVIMTPTGGHGANPILELFMSQVAITTNFFKDPLRDTPDTNFYTKIGLVKNPVFKSGVTPLTFDNRVKITINSDVEADFPVNAFVTQEIGSQEVQGTVHEVEWDEQEQVTNIWLHDTIGTYSAQFTSNLPCEVRPSFESSQRPSTFIINNVVTELYEPYSGQLLHFVNFEPIERTPDRREKIKLVFDF